MNYYIFSIFHSGNKVNRDVKFRHSKNIANECLENSAERGKCRNTRFPVPKKKLKQ